MSWASRNFFGFFLTLNGKETPSWKCKNGTPVIQCFGSSDDVARWRKRHLLTCSTQFQALFCYVNLTVYFWLADWCWQAFSPHMNDFLNFLVFSQNFTERKLSWNPGKIPFHYPINCVWQSPIRNKSQVTRIKAIELSKMWIWKLNHSLPCINENIQKSYIMSLSSQ